MEHYKLGDDLEVYSYNLASELFAGITRRSGLPYTQEHLVKVAMGIDDVLLESPYKKASVCAGYIHDAAEDIARIGVFDPWSERPFREEGKIYLNDLFENAGIMGEYTSFIVDLVTHKQWMMNYHDYFERIFNFDGKSHELKNLHISASVLKAIDLRLNTNPDERENAERTLYQYRLINDYDELYQFYRKTKTLDYMRKAGGQKLDFVDESILMSALEKNFRQSQRARANNNLSDYLPLAEQELLVKLGESNGLFDYNKLRSVMKSLWVDSLIIYSSDYPLEDKNDSIYEVRKMGRNKDALKKQGYIPLLKEIREDILSGRLDLRAPKAPLFSKKEEPLLRRIS